MSRKALLEQFSEDGFVVAHAAIEELTLLRLPIGPGRMASAFSSAYYVGLHVGLLLSKRHPEVGDELLSVMEEALAKIQGTDSRNEAMAYVRDLVKVYRKAETATH